jgi:pimeloyl-ACP methyl ester carboxylesterase
VQISLSFRVTGSGPPLVILHGLFGSGTNWRRIADNLKHHWQVFTLDLPNHGKSPWVSNMSYPAQAQAVAQFIQQHALHRPALLGHSMGGKTAMAVALTTQIKLRALIVADIAPVSYQHSHGPLVRTLQQLDLTNLTSRQQADQALAGDIPDRALRQFLLQNLGLRNNTLYWRLNLDVINTQIDSLSGFPNMVVPYDGPALFVYGSRSDYIDATHTPTIKSLFPQSQMHAISNAGHWLHVEQPEAFLSAIKDFLSS